MPRRCCDSWTASSEHLWGAAICHNAPVQPQHRLVSVGWGSYQKVMHCKLKMGWGWGGGGGCAAYQCRTPLYDVRFAS